MMAENDARKRIEPKVHLFVHVRVRAYVSQTGFSAWESSSISKFPTTDRSGGVHMAGTCIMRHPTPASRVGAACHDVARVTVSSREISHRDDAGE